MRPPKAGPPLRRRWTGTALSIALGTALGIAAGTAALITTAPIAEAAQVSATRSFASAPSCSAGHTALQDVLYAQALGRCGRARVGRMVPRNARYRRGTCTPLGGGDSGGGVTVSGTLVWSGCVNRRGSF